MKEYFEVTNKIYTDKYVNEYRPAIGWVHARPALYSPSLLDSFKHWRGKHWSYGQHFCIICGKERAN